MYYEGGSHDQMFYLTIHSNETYTRTWKAWISGCILWSATMEYSLNMVQYGTRIHVVNIQQVIIHVPFRDFVIVGVVTEPR